MRIYWGRSCWELGVPRPYVSSMRWSWGKGSASVGSRGWLIGDKLLGVRLGAGNGDGLGFALGGRCPRQGLVGVDDFLAAAPLGRPFGFA